MQENLLFLWMATNYLPKEKKKKGKEKIESKSLLLICDGDS